MAEAAQPFPLSHVFKLWDNTTLRAGPDEADVLSLAKSFTFQTDEHGFGPADIVLPRPSSWDPFDSAMLAGVETRDQSGQLAYRGRVIGRPRTGVNEVTIQCEGYSKHADDDETARMIFRDMDQTHWQGASAAYKIADIGGSVDEVDAGASPDTTTGLPTIDTVSTTPFSRTQDCIAMYDGKGVPLGSIYGAGSLYQLGAGGAGTFFGLSVDDKFTNYEGTANLTGAATSFATTFNATKSGQTWAWLETTIAAITANSGLAAGTKWTAAIPYGSHGLTKQGAEPQSGFYVSDMVQYIVNRWCPLWTTLADSIESTTFIVPHAVFTDTGTTAGKMLDALIVFGGNSLYPLDWFVYENFNLRSPGNYGRTYRVRRDEGAESLDQGPDVSMMLNGIQVTYNPGDGTSKTIGPTGSNSTIETDFLRITDPNHPANRLGIRQWKGLDAGVMNSNSAILLGQLALAARNYQQWRGTVTQRGTVRDSSGNAFPPYMMRALEQVIVEDDPDLRPRRVVGTTYNDKERSVSLDIGQLPDRIDQVLARAGVVITSSGAS